MMWILYMIVTTSSGALHVDAINNFTTQAECQQYAEQYVKPLDGFTITGECLPAPEQTYFE